MPGESNMHRSLVRYVSRYVAEQHGSNGNLALYSDEDDELRQRPQRIGGHLPDVYAEDVPRTFVVLGEAKTTTDLETDRTKRQLSAFIRCLSLYDVSYFYLAVPLLRNLQLTD